MPAKSWTEKINAMNNSLTEVIDSLKCCGNCINAGVTNGCQHGVQKKYLSHLHFKCCKLWKFDGLEPHERAIDIVADEE